MNRVARAFLVGAALFAVVGPTSAQTPALSHAPTARKYCHDTLEFCFWYPRSWKLLGEVFDGNGVVIAPEQKDGRELWDVITVATVAPASESGGATLDSVIERTTTAMRDTGQHFETLQRQARTVDGAPAQVLTVRYREASTSRDWIEELVFIEGHKGEVYSVALKCAPDALIKREPVLKRLLATWTLPDEDSTTIHEHLDTARPAGAPPPPSPR